VLLGIRDDKSFPLIFYRSDCADAALDESDINEKYIASAKSIVVTGTHFANVHNAAAQKKAMKLAKKHGAKIAFDIDYRPNLWGLAGHDAGEERYIKSGDVTAHLTPILGQCDLIVGTEEEVKIAGGEDTPLAALKAIREKSSAMIVMKWGPMGCVVFPGAIPEDIEKGLKGPGFPVEVYNVLGAGDAFMSGFCSGGFAMNRSKHAALMPMRAALSPSRASYVPPNMQHSQKCSILPKMALKRPLCATMRHSHIFIGQQRATQ